MRDSAVFSLALRYLSFMEQGVDGRYRLQSLSSNKSLSSMIGLALAAAVLLIVLSIVNGFEREMRLKILSMVPHAVIHRNQGIEDWQATANFLMSDQYDKSLVRPIAVAPLVSFQALLVKEDHLSSAEIKGVIPLEEEKVSIINQLVTRGSFEALAEQSYSLVLGSELAGKLDLDVGDKVKLMLPEAQISLLGMLPRYRQFTVVGIIEVGSELDGQLVYIPLESALKLLRQKEVQSLRVKMDDVFNASWDAWELVAVLNGIDSSKDREQSWVAMDWTQTQGTLYEIIIMTKSMLGLLVLLIVIVACFNLSSGLIMVVQDKRADIAILLSQGLQPRQLVKVFLLQAFIISLTGLFVGFCVAALVLQYIGDWVSNLEQVLQVDLTSAYPVHYLPSEILFQDVLLISVAVLLLSFIASVYPAMMASRVNPAEELKNE